jgi:hypothetical protein
MTRTRGDRAVVSLDLVIVLTAVILAGVLALTRPGADPGDHEPQATPGELPSTGQYVRANISAEGALEVTHLVSTQTPVSSLLLRAPSSAGQPGTTRVENVAITTSGATVATLPSIGREAQQVTLGRSVRQLTVTYRIAPALGGDPATVKGRTLAFVPALRIDYSHETGPIRRLVTAPGEILNVACVRIDGEAPRPCGTATSDGWQVDLDGEDRDDGLLVQTQLDD